MDRSLRWRSIGLLAIVAFCVLTLLPSVVGYKALPSWYDSFFSKKIQLGLDLQGGLHIVYSIDLDKAVDDKASEIKRDVEAHLEAEKIEGTVSTPAALGAVTIKVADPAKLELVRKWVMSSYDDVVVGRTCSSNDGASSVCVRVSSDYADSIKSAALSQAVETIRSRIDENGVSEPTVITKGDDIIVELPGLDEANISRIKDIIARTAKLEFKVVDQDSPYMRDLFKHVREDPEAARLEIKADVDGWRHDDTGKSYDDYYLYAHNREEWITVEEAKETACWDDEKSTASDGQTQCLVSGRRVIERYLAELGKADPKFAIPDDRQIAYERVTPAADAEDKREFWRTYFLDRAVRLTGAAVTNAITIWDPQTNRPEVLVEFNRYGTRVFGDLTSEATGRKMAIILDDKVASAPVIQSAITGGRSNISMGGGSAEEQQREADVLVAVLKTGSLPAPLKAESSATLGPTLGQDAITKTQFSFALGTVLVLIIMIVVYRFAGFLAIGALAINILIMLAAMATFGATLTLPGIAALVLTVGMAVDGNILVYERIRDELHGGKSVRGAVETGFARAFTTVLDGHLTTAAAGWVLLQYGSGPIQGFAVMLLVGIGTTLFTTVWVTRVFFDLYLAKNKTAETLSI